MSITFLLLSSPETFQTEGVWKIRASSISILLTLGTTDDHTLVGHGEADIEVAHLTHATRCEAS